MTPIYIGARHILSSDWSAPRSPIHDRGRRTDWTAKRLPDAAGCCGCCGCCTSQPYGWFATGVAPEPEALTQLLVDDDEASIAAPAADGTWIFKLFVSQDTGVPVACTGVRQRRERSPHQQRGRTRCQAGRQTLHRETRTEECAPPSGPSRCEKRGAPSRPAVPGNGRHRRPRLLYFAAVRHDKAPVRITRRGL